MIPSKSVVPIFAPRITPIACVSPRTPEPTSARVMSEVTEELCNIAVVNDPVRIDHRFVVVKVLSKLLILFEL
ncbi:MAG: hypothetical protein RL023_448 [Candidatus Parcubacteria bacterium]